jgi:hypothetical protein
MPCLAARERHGENERAWCRHHQHGDGADRIGTREPSHSRQHDGRGQEQQRVAVGEPRHRRARALGGGDQADDPGIGALGGAARCHEMEGFPGIARAAHDEVADLLLHRHRFTGQRRLVENGQAFRDLAVNGDHVALADHQPVARLDHVEVDLFQLTVAVPDGAARNARQQRRHLVPGAALGEALEVLAAGIHERDDRRRKVFGKQQRREHRQRCNDVEADIAAPQADDDFDREQRQHRDSRNGPDRAGPLWPTKSVRQNAEDEAGSRPRHRHGPRQ